jgi:hypothetical protein
MLTNQKPHSHLGFGTRLLDTRGRRQIWTNASSDEDENVIG